MSDHVKPTECCDVGTYKCQVPMPLNGRLQSIDYCIADIVAALNAANIPTVASCCGHSKFPGSIIFMDGREMVVRKHVRHWEQSNVRKDSNVPFACDDPSADFDQNSEDKITLPHSEVAELLALIAHAERSRRKGMIALTPLEDLSKHAESKAREWGFIE